MKFRTSSLKYNFDLSWLEILYQMKLLIFKVLLFLSNKRYSLAKKS